MLDHIDTDLTALEQNVTKAEEDLGYNNSGIKGFFKPLLDKVSKTQNRNADSRSVPQSLPPYESVETFKAQDYFEASHSNETDRSQTS